MAGFDLEQLAIIITMTNIKKIRERKTQEAGSVLWTLETNVILGDSRSWISPLDILTNIYKAPQSGFQNVIDYYSAPHDLEITK